MREGFENMIQHVAKAEFLIDDGAAVRPADKGRGGGDLRQTGKRRYSSYGEIRPKTCDRDSGHPQRAAYSQQPLLSRVIFGRGLDLRLGPRPLADFQVKIAPALIHAQ